MKNLTVKDVIEVLNKLNPEAVVCRLVPDDEYFYSSVEMIKEISNTIYIDDSGDDVEGDIVMIY